ncbi:uncharacterized protein G2W53_034846 [Senna tora]|uniref:Uncharacterized protein n=1 Tax=Senna tora TaxID=362788 RepID=A0A834T3C2_9FABA|nr:uncharacterized protein G2W53_034846 [Senna tora]
MEEDFILERRKHVGVRLGKPTLKADWSDFAATAMAPPHLSSFYLFLRRRRALFHTRLHFRL